MMFRILFMLLCLVVQACLLVSGNDSSEKNFDAASNDGVQLNVEIEQPCRAQGGSPAASFTDMFGNTEYMRSDLRNCKITVTHRGKNVTDGGIMNADLSDVARVIMYFCDDNTSPPPHLRKVDEMQLCQAARDALGNLIFVLEATKFAEADSVDATLRDRHAEYKDFLEGCYQPDIIDIDRIPSSASAFIKLYPNKCGAELPLRAYLTYIYSQLNAQSQLEAAFTSNAILKAGGIDYDTVRFWYKLSNVPKLDSMFIIGGYGNTALAGYKASTAKNAQLTYWNKCFTIVKKFIEQQGINTTALKGNFYQSDSVALSATHEYTYFSNYSAKFVITLDAAQVQLEEVKDKMLHDLHAALSRAGKSREAVAAAVSADIKAYITELQSLRALVDKVGLASHP